MNTARVLTIDEDVQGDGQARLALRGELDIASVPSLQDAVAGVLEQEHLPFMQEPSEQ